MLWTFDLVQRRQWWEFHKIPVTLPVRLKTFFYFRSWRGQMHREKLTWKHCKWKLIGSGKEGETVNLGPNGCKNKWTCANSEVVSWLPKQIRYCKDMLGVDEEFDVCNFSCWHLDNFVNIFNKRINQVSEYPVKTELIKKFQKKPWNWSSKTVGPKRGKSSTRPLLPFLGWISPERGRKGLKMPRSTLFKW